MVGMVRGGDKRWDVLADLSETVQIHLSVPLLIAVSGKVNDMQLSVGGGRNPCLSQVVEELA